MVIKIVSDSTADLPEGLAEKLGIIIVPEYLRFGEKVYRDHIDITTDEFYHRLVNDPIHPKTMQTSPDDFREIFEKNAPGADGIVCLTLSSKLSGTFNNAVAGQESAKTTCPIKVIDTQSVTMGLGELAIAANEMAQAGKSITEITDAVTKMIPNIRILGLVDTLKYLALGGRIGKVQALVGSMLNVKPMLAVKDGVLTPSGRVRSRSKGIDILVDYVKKATNIQDLAVIHNTTPDEANILANKLRDYYPVEKIRIARLGPALGVHTGPGILFVAIRVGG
jgi:DegV family protein with EDD domain